MEQHIDQQDLKRLPFREVFDELSDGSLRPKMQIEVNDTNFGTSTIFQKGVIFGGIDFHLYKYFDVATRSLPSGVVKIEGFYKDL